MSTFLKMNRFLQQPSECALAATASVAHYYNKDIDYEYVRNICQPNDNFRGLWTPEVAILANRLGFEDVTVITADIRQLDFQWKNLTTRQLINRLSKNQKKYSDYESKQITKAYLDFLTNKECNNSVIIDNQFGKYIRKHISQKKPVLASFNWHLFFKQPKKNNRGILDPIKGDYEEHEVVIYGCDDKGVDILDSHHQCYHGPLEKYRTGRYRIDWETLHTVMGFGDLVLVDKYNKKLLDKYELVS